MEQIQETWRDLMDFDANMEVYLVRDEPPRATGEGHQGHLLIVQRSLNIDAKAILISSQMTTYRTRLMRCAHLLAPIINRDLILRLGDENSQCNVLHCTVMTAREVVTDLPTAVEDGDGVILYGEPRQPLEHDPRTHLQEDAPSSEDDAISLLARAESQAAMDPSPPDEDGEHSQEYGYEYEDVHPDSDWVSAIIFNVQGEGIVGRLQETHPELHHREVAFMMGITVNSLIHVHEVRHRPSDIEAAMQNAYIIQQLGDIPVGSTGRLLLLDVDFCNPLPQLLAETQRQVKVMASPFTRSQLLRLLRLDRYCAAPGTACLVHHNHNLLHTQTDSPISLEHGDYIKVTLSPPEQCQTISTRLACLGHYHGLTAAAYPHLQLQLPHSMNLDQVPNPAVCLDNLEESESFSLLQLMMLKDSNRIEGKMVLPSRKQQCWHQARMRSSAARHRSQRSNTTARAHDTTDHPHQPAAHGADDDANDQQALDNLRWLQMTVARQQVHPPEGLLVQTWYLSHQTARRCNIPRPVPLQGEVEEWRHTLEQAWRDEIDFQAPTAFYVVDPSPYELEQNIWAHVLLVQHPEQGEIGIHVTVFDSGIHNGQAIRFATVTNELVTHDGLTELADRDRVCHREAATCRSWMGWHEITWAAPQLYLNGNAFALSVERGEPLKTAEDENMTSLQSSPSCRTTLSLADKIACPTCIVDLVPSETRQGFPKVLEVSYRHTATEIRDELITWGFTVHAFQFGHHDAYFCCLEMPPEDAAHVYMYVSSDTRDAAGRILHSGDSSSTELEHMRLLHQLGYIRAAILETHTLLPWLTQIIFEESYGIMQPKGKIRPPPTWPAPFPPGEHDDVPPSSMLQDLRLEKPHCLLDFPGTIEDITALLACGKNKLTTSLDGLELPDFVQEAITSTHQLETLDRLIIYTDGSASSNSNRQVPDMGRDPNELIDSWAFVVLGEQYDPMGGQSKISFLGWHTQRVLYRPESPHFAGAMWAGSHTAEREAMLWALIWRLGIDSNIPTVVRPDSQVTGAQAAGICGSNCNDYGFNLLRSTFQLLETIIPTGYFKVEWTPGHCGDPWNEIADVAAKTESRKSFYMDRLTVDLRHWEHRWFHLWTVFDTKSGLPEKTAYGFDAVPPHIPDEQAPQPAQPALPSSAKVQLIHYKLSLSTGNVNSLYTGPTGHAGKLSYLRQQMKHHHLNVMGIQESRASQGTTSVDEILRLAGGANKGCHGTELWINLQQPYGYANNRGLCFKPQHFVVVHADPRLLLVKTDTGHFKCWFLVMHAPQSGQSAHARDAWWQALHEVLHAHIDGEDLYVMADANAGCGDPDGKHVIEHSGPNTPNTLAMQTFLQAFDLCLPSTSSIHEGPRDTWWSPDGLTTACIDYVMVPCSRAPHCTLSKVMEDFDLGQTYDHSPVALTVERTDEAMRAGTTTDPTSLRQGPHCEPY